MVVRLLVIEFDMLTLYYKTTCPFCQRVLGEAEDMGVQFNLKDISSDETLAEELIARGGKRQVPYLVDEEKGVEMYESGDIIEYLQGKQSTSESKESFNGLRIHKSDEACDTCQ